MSIYKIAKDSINQSPYKTESSLQRAILNYINNCLLNFGVSVDNFKHKAKYDVNEFKINNTLEDIIKNYISNGKRFPYVNHFESWKQNPEWYQRKVDETIIVVKNFLSCNFTEETYKSLRQTIKENMEEVSCKIENANKLNIHHQDSILSNVSSFVALLSFDKQNLEEYFSVVCCARESLSYDEYPKFNTHEKIILEFIQYSNTLRKIASLYTSEYMLNYCTAEHI